jgi:hypothetical protein
MVFSPHFFAIIIDETNLSQESTRGRIVNAAASPGLMPSPSLRGARKFRLIPHFEDDSQVIAFAQTIPGKLTLLAVFGLSLSLLDDRWPLQLGLVSCATFLPRTRRLFVTIGTILVTDFFWFEHGTLSLVTVHSATQFPRVTEFLWIIVPFVLLCAGLMFWSAKYPKSLVGQRPLLTLMAICGVLTLLGCYAPLTGFPRFAVWAFLGTFCLYVWFLAYAMLDCAKPAGDNLFYQAGTFHPFWGSTSVPLPKGASHWRRIEAKTPEDLAVTMVKGVKLIIWCLLLSLIRTGYRTLIHEKLLIPTPSYCLQTFQAGKPLSWGLNWLSWPDDMLLDLLSISIWGHGLIATCRMAGFRALRNTYAPLSSRTIAEYWNRYYFYFKELLVDMFFYPTFIRYFKGNPKLRIFFATFVAASLGNTLFHFLTSLHVAVSFGLMATIRGYENYFFYSLVLALGIGLSQIRGREHLPSQGWFREKIVAPACVLGFYCFLHVFALSSPSTSLRYLGFLLKGK